MMDGVIMAKHLAMLAHIVEGNDQGGHSVTSLRALMPGLDGRKTSCVLQRWSQLGYIERRGVDRTNRKHPAVRWRATERGRAALDKSREHYQLSAREQARQLMREYQQGENAA